MLLGLATVVFMSEKSITKALASCVFGLLLGTVGLDPLYGEQRLTFGEVKLLDGIDFVIVAMGLFAISEVVANIEEPGFVSAAKARFSDLFPSRTDIRKCLGTFARCTGLGFIVGVLPGAGSAVSSFLAYSMEKAVSKNGKDFGKGAVEGVAAPETADNAAAVGAMVPLFTLGIPGSGSTAILLGAMMMYGVRPGPLIFEQQPEFIWGIIASMYIGNVMLLILNLPLIPLFALLLRLNYAYLYPIILVICVIGSYSLRGQVFDVGLMLGFGVIGYIMRKFSYPVAPVLLGVVLGPLIERAYSQSLSMSQGDPSIFLSSILSTTLLLVTMVLLFVGIARHVRGSSNAAA
jgi:putative tricarboxylic transport membrane protein